MLLFSLLPIIVVFVLLYLVIKWAVSSALHSEIGREEYERMRRDIQAK